MKNIELTEDHKSKLLEMCKALFPEYFYWEISKKQFIQSHIVGNDTEIYEDEKPDLKIHWFEFCMTHLIVKLSKEFTKQKLSEADYTDNQYPNWFSEKVSYHLNPFRNEEFEEDILFIHPVDYLYEEFLKLK